MNKEFKIFKEGVTDRIITILSDPSRPFDKYAKIRFYQNLGYTVFDMNDNHIKP